MASSSLIVISSDEEDNAPKRNLNDSKKSRHIYGEVSKDDTDIKVLEKQIGMRTSTTLPPSPYHGRHLRSKSAETSPTKPDYHQQPKRSASVLCATKSRHTTQAGDGDAGDEKKTGAMDGSVTPLIGLEKGLTTANLAADGRDSIVDNFSTVISTFPKTGSAVEKPTADERQPSARGESATPSILIVNGSTMQNPAAGEKPGARNRSPTVSIPPKNGSASDHSATYKNLSGANHSPTISTLPKDRSATDHSATYKNPSDGNHSPTISTLLKDRSATEDPDIQIISCVQRRPVPHHGQVFPSQFASRQQMSMHSTSLLARAPFRNNHSQLIPTPTVPVAKMSPLQRPLPAHHDLPHQAPPYARYSHQPKIAQRQFPPIQYQQPHSHNRPPPAPPTPHPTTAPKRKAPPSIPPPPFKRAKPLLPTTTTTVLSSAPTAPTPRPRNRAWTAAMLTDFAQTLESSFDFGDFATKHGKAERDIRDTFAAVVYRPLFEFSGRGLGRARMREFNRRVREGGGCGWGDETAAAAAGVRDRDRDRDSRGGGGGAGKGTRKGEGEGGKGSGPAAMAREGGRGKGEAKEVGRAKKGKGSGGLRELGEELVLRDGIYR